MLNTASSNIIRNMAIAKQMFYLSRKVFDKKTLKCIFFAFNCLSAAHVLYFINRKAAQVVIEEK
jgi:hypothetical protein